ncbi:hypothetical protein [Sphingobium sp.]|uniref:hypothetical protein n=1 Tax=Sphingobium sp. TaxID=1912891 RepID=UPI002CEC8BC3|nr:hypothetical protein [Sphingobium sp.]HUD92600.1 hypothetical protein [Sphingobium sp.]
MMIDRSENVADQEFRADDFSSAFEIDPRTTRTDWLIGHFDDLDWILATPIPGNPPASVRFSWNFPVSEGERLSDYRYHDWLELARYAAWWYRESDKTECNKDSSRHLFATDLRRGIVWFIQYGLQGPKDLTPYHLTKYEDHLSQLSLSCSTVQGRLIAIRMLWVLRAHLPVKISFEPYRSKRSLSEAVRRIGRPNQHTTTIPPRQFYELCEHALQWMDHADRIITIRDNYLMGLSTLRKERGYNVAQKACRREMSESLIEHSQSWPFNFSQNDNDPLGFLKSCLKCLYASCIVTVIAFIAIRKHQFALINADPIKTVGDIEYLVGSVRKSSPDEQAIPTEHAVDSIVRQAIAHLDHLSDFARTEKHSSLLISDPFLSRGEAIGSPLLTGSLYNMLDEFAVSAGFDTEQFGSLRPQMIRRANTLIYVWQYEISDLQLLQKHLNQTNIKSSSAYTNEKNLSLYQSDANRQLAYRVLEESLTGQKPIVGGFSHYIAKLRSKLKVLTVDRLQIFVAQLVEKHDIRFTAHPHGYCVLASHRKQFARCSTDGMGPDYAQRRDVDCAVCPNFATHRLFRGHWVNQQRIHQLVIDDARSTWNAVAAAKLGLKASAKMLEDIDGT